MEKSPFNNLSPSMQERLNRWKLKVSHAKSVPIPKPKSPGNFVARRSGNGDDFSDYEQKMQEEKKLRGE